MLAGKLQRLPWQLTLALFATLPAVHSASIEASNSSAGDMFDYSGQLYLQDKDGNNLTELVPLSREATSKNLEGNLYLTTDATYNSIAEDDIAYISCDTYKGQIQAADVFESAYNTNRINGAVFYSTTALYCVFNNMTDFMQNFPVYSMNSTTDSAMLERRLEEPATSRFSVDVVRSAANSSSHDGQQNTQNGAGGSNPNPLGPSPSTAVAMIILYSITGIITALFLVIIITGAIRAHRHPDRYGPRDVLGRPRQSRARGLGRAILDTLPIVKFGQTEEQPKPADVELGSTAEARDVNAATAGTETTTTTHNADGTTTETRAAPVTPASRDQNGEQHSGMESGISAAQPAVAGTAAATHTESEDSGLGCSICTEDFEQGQDIRVLPCNHKFHPECVDPWLLNVSGTCPLCRVDLRPVRSHSTTSSLNGDHDDPNHLAPPLQTPDNDMSRRRRSVMRDILSFRSRPDASADERISALRRLREQRRNRSDEGVSGQGNGSAEDVAGAGARRSKRMSVRLSGVFGGGRRRAREESPTTNVQEEGESSGTAAAPAAATTGPAVSRTEPRPSNEDARPGTGREQR